MTNPFTIPELRDHLATFLKKKDLLKCILVCKEWNDSFIPALYTDITISQKTRNPKVESVKQNLVHIKSLTITESIDPAYYSLEFSNLSKLQIPFVIPPRHKDAQTTPWIPQLLINSKDTLTSFSISSAPIGDLRMIWESLLECSQITHLEFQSNIYFKIDSLNVEKFISFFTRITTLKLHFIDIFSDNAIIQELPTLIQSSNIVDLDCHGIGSNRNHLGLILLNLIFKSPNLRSIRWKASGQFDRSEMANDYSENVFRELIPTIVSRSFNSLELTGDMTDDDLALLLRSMTDARELRLNQQCFEEMSYHALVENHCDTITTLDIKGCTGVTSSMLQGIMSRCPSLVSLAAGSIRGTDLVCIMPPSLERAEEEEVILGQDWVCLKLRELKLFIDLSSSHANIDRSTPEGEELFRKQQKLEQYHAFRQISRLHSLHTLDISHRHRNNHTRTLDMRLRSSGGELDQLCTLKKLRVLLPRLSPFDVGQEEKRWMEKYWSLDD